MLMGDKVVEVPEDVLIGSGVEARCGDRAGWC